jgi:hypothetical protein
MADKAPELGRKPMRDDELEATMVEADPLDDKESLENQISRRRNAAKIREEAARKAAALREKVE